jgi:hypothetical protein
VIDAVACAAETAFASAPLARISLGNGDPVAAMAAVGGRAFRNIAARPALLGVP